MYRDNWQKAGPPGRPMPRPAGTPTPCWRCPKTASLPPDQRTPANAVNLSLKNWRAYRYYLEIKAGAPMPDDRLVRRNCALFRWAEDQVERAHSDVGGLASVLMRKKR